MYDKRNTKEAMKELTGITFRTNFSFLLHSPTITFREIDLQRDAISFYYLQKLFTKSCQ